MALVPKLASAGSAIATSGPRPAAGARVASLGNSAIEQASISTETFFDTSPYEYTDGRSRARNDDHQSGQQPPHRRNHFGVLNATSEIYAAILESGTTGGVIDDFGNTHQPTTPSVVSQAITTYELNSQVISGDLPKRGGELSLSL